MLKRNLKVSSSDRFRIPFGIDLEWREVLEIYDHFEKEMDGQTEDNYLLFYYEKSPISNIYEFRDNNSELDIADILGIDLIVCRDGETKNQKIQRNEKDSQNLKIAKIQKDVLKKLKKERRAEKILQKNIKSF